MFRQNKSQTATEYIVIVSVVIVIALVVVQIMGGFPGIGSGTSKKISDYKLASSDNVGIDKYYFSDYSALFSLKNNYFETLRVENFSVNGIVCNSSNTNISGTSSIGIPLILNPGQIVVVNCSSLNFSVSQNYGLTPLVLIIYTNPNTGVSYSSIIGNSYVTSNLESGNQNSSNTSSDTVLALRQGLLAYWSFDVDYSDLSGNANSGTSYNSAIQNITGGLINGVSQFNGSSYLVMQNNYPLNSVNFNNSAISLWVKPASISDNTLYWLIGKSDASNYGWNIWLDGSLNYCTLGVNRGTIGVSLGLGYGATICLMGAAPANVWTHIVIENIQNSTYHHLKAYVNGALDTDYDLAYHGIGPIFLNSSVYNVSMGRRNDNYYYFRGSLDEVALYNRTLNFSEITSLYNNGTGLSLDISGVHNPICSADQTNCSGTNYITCSSGSWVNNGNVYGHCGYVDLTLLKAGLIAYWPLDLNYSDMSGNINTGNPINSPIQNSSGGLVNGAVQFDGVNDYVVMQNNFPLNISNFNNSAISFWVKPNSTSDNTFYWLIGKNDAYNNGWGIWLDGSYNYCGLGASRGTIAMNPGLGYNAVICFNRSAPANNWTHILVQHYYNSTYHHLKAYVNGVLDTDYDLTAHGIGPIFLNAANYNVTMGRRNDNYYYYHGTLDEIAFFNRTLDASEISSLYNNGAGLSLVQ